MQELSLSARNGDASGEPAYPFLAEDAISQRPFEYPVSFKARKNNNNNRCDPYSALFSKLNNAAGLGNGQLCLAAF